MGLTPYYDEDGITIYCGDCVGLCQSLDMGDVAAIVMDPPYASGARSEVKKSSSGAMLRGERGAEKPREKDQKTTGGLGWGRLEGL